MSAPTYCDRHPFETLDVDGDCDACVVVAMSEDWGTGDCDHEECGFGAGAR